MASQRDQLVSAIRAYESSPDKGQFDTEMLRNMMTAAQEEGIDWQPDFSLKRAGMSLLDGLAMGLLPGDHALTKGERFAGGVGDIAGLAIPGIGLARGFGAVKSASNIGGRAVAALSKGGTAAAAVTRQTAKVANYSLGKLAIKKGSILQELALNTNKAGNAMKGKGEIVKKLQSKLVRVEQNILRTQNAELKLDATIKKGFDSLGNFVTGSAGAQNAIRGAAGFGTAGAVRGGVRGYEEGDPLGGAISGGLSGAMLGAAGGGLSPYASSFAKNNKLISTMAGGSLLGSMASNY